MVDWSQLLAPAFWFSVRWNPLQPRTALLMAGFFVCLVVIGVVGPWLAVRGKKVPRFERAAWQMMGRPLWVAGLLGLLFTFLAYERIAVFSGRFWFLAIGVYFVVAGVLAGRNFLQEMEHGREAEEERVEREKYLS